LRGSLIIIELVFEKNAFFTGYNTYQAHFALRRLERNFAETFVSIIMSIVKALALRFLLPRAVPMPMSTEVYSTENNRNQHYVY
jgi:hypothetical protein